MPLATPRLFWLLIGALLVTLGGAVEGRLIGAGIGLTGALVIAYVFDRAATTGPDDVQVLRSVPDVLSLGRWHDIVFRLRYPGRRPVRLLLRDDTPVHFSAVPDELHARLPARSTQTLAYAVRSTRRGPAAFGDVAVRAIGPLGLAMRQWTVPAARETAVYPDITTITRYDIALRRGALRRFGVRPARALGEGREFDRLREYVVGDDSRHIDWKATAKRGAPITREYEAERSQRIVIVLDAGRLMTARVGEFTKLDYAINAALLLAHVGMQHGDQVGVLLFSDQVDAYVPPRRSAQHLARFVDVVAAAQPRLLESNYVAAFNYLALHTRRRTLVTVFTDLVDPDASSVLLTQMARLSRRHLPLCITMRDADVDRALDAPVRALHDAFLQMAAGEVRQAYEAVMTKLTRSGALVVNAPADGLSMATVNRYLDVKARGLL